MNDGKESPKIQGVSHAQARALERYGLRLVGLDFAELKRQIQNGEAMKLRSQGRKVGIYLCVLRGRDFIVVWDRRSKFAVTVLPPDDPRLLPPKSRTGASWEGHGEGSEDRRPEEGHAE
jgi:hypothetical protein